MKGSALRGESGRGGSISRQKWLLITLVALTAAHLAYRIWQGRPPADAPEVSTMAVGDRLPDHPAEISLAESARAEALLSPGAACQLIVVFDPTCPHCRRAAQREADRGSEARLPTTWVAEEGGPRLSAYRGLVHPASRLGWAPEIMRHMRVQGVPAGFLVNGEGVLLRVWPYEGDEDHAEYSRICSEWPPVTPSPAVAGS